VKTIVTDPFPLLERQRVEQVVKSFYDYKMPLSTLIDSLTEANTKATTDDVVDLYYEMGSQSSFLIGKRWETDTELRERSRQDYLANRRQRETRRAQYEALKKEFET